MRKMTIYSCAVISLSIAQVVSFAGDLSTESLREKMKYVSHWQHLSAPVSKEALPYPFDYLLTQPLMTKGLENFYQRTPIIQTIYAKKNPINNTYHRAIMMVIDTDKARNNVQLAQPKKETLIVELAFITMNFNQLPEKIITDVLTTNTPFGKLLAHYPMKISTTGRTYFWLKCDKVLASLTRCRLHSKLYGRTNTIVNVDNNQWLAHVVEILPGFLK